MFWFLTSAPVWLKAEFDPVFFIQTAVIFNFDICIVAVMLLLILFSRAINKLKHASSMHYDQDTFVLLPGVLFLNFKS